MPALSILFLQTVLLLLLGCPAFTSKARGEEPGPAMLARNSVKAGDVNIYALLDAAELAFTVRFCCESFSASNENSFPSKTVSSSEYVDKTLPQFLNTFRSHGVDAFEDGPVIVLRSRGQLTNIPDPLDIVVPQFLFNGTHLAFLGAVGSLFPELPPGLISDTTSGDNVVYTFDIDHPINLRGILQEFTKKYKRTWMFYIAEWDKPLRTLTPLEQSRVPIHDISWSFRLSQ